MFGEITSIRAIPDREFHTIEIIIEVDPASQSYEGSLKEREEQTERDYVDMEKFHLGVVELKQEVQ